MSALEELTSTVPTRSRGQPWTADEDAVLRADYGRSSALEIGLAIGRSVEAVRQRAIALGLTRRVAARIRWTPAAVARLRAGYRHGATAELARELGTTTLAVQKQAQALGLARPTPHRPWTPEQDALARELYGLVPTDELAARLGHSRSALYLRLTALGITRERAQAARYARDQAEIRRLKALAEPCARAGGRDAGDERRASILLAWRMNAIGAEEAAVALGVPVARLAVELGKAAAAGQAAVAAAEVIERGWR